MDSIYDVHFSKLVNALCSPSAGKMLSRLLLLLNGLGEREAGKQPFSEVGAHFVTFRKVVSLEIKATSEDEQPIILVEQKSRQYCLLFTSNDVRIFYG